MRRLLPLRPGPCANQLLAAVALLTLLALPVSAGDATIVGPAAVPAPGYPCRLFVQGDLPKETIVGWDVSPRIEGVTQVKPLPDGLSADLTTLAGPESTRGVWRVSVAIHEPGRAIYFRYLDVFVPGTPYTPPDPPTPVPPAPRPEPKPVPPPQPVPPNPDPKPVPVPAGEFGISPKVAAAVKPIAQTQRAKLDAVGAALEVIASQISAGTIKDAAMLMEALKPALATIETAEGKTVRADVLAVFQETFDAHKSGRLAGTGTSWTFKDPASWALLLRETAIGVKAI